MKKRIAALAACLALALTACGQQKQAPATVGTIGSVDIPGGVYQLAQFSAYAEADSLTSEDNVLKAKLNMDGETVTGKAYIAAKTLEALERYKKDPRHVAVSQLCKSIRESRGAVDFEL